MLGWMVIWCILFFFQAEDGIRDGRVTGVQTCALPISYVYATDLAGADRGVVRIRGARAVDWEDIALGPCATQRAACLYIADTGDNEMARKSVVIYAVAEPDPPGRQSGPVRSAPAAALRLKFAGGPDDVEAIYVSPRDSALYLVSKGRRGGDTVVTASPLQRLPI